MYIYNNVYDILILYDAEFLCEGETKNKQGKYKNQLSKGKSLGVFEDRTSLMKFTIIENLISLLNQKIFAI